MSTTGVISTQCIGTAKSTGQRCKRSVKQPGTFCGRCAGVKHHSVDTPAAAVQDLDQTVDPFAIEGHGVDYSAAGDFDEPPLIPIPETLERGNGVGEPVLLGGGDLYDSTATLVAYQDAHDPEGERLVLHARVTPEGEQKLVEALGFGQTKLVTHEVEEQVTEEHPIDSQLGLHAKIEQIARSLNSRIKKGESLEERNAVNEPRLDALVAAMEQAKAQGAPQEMLDHYEAHIEQLVERMTPGFDLPYNEGGKIPMLARWDYNHTVTKTVTEEVVVDNLDDALLPTIEQPATRLAVNLNAEGRSTWSGKTKQAEGSGVEWKIDLGDGFTAHFRPTSKMGPGDEWSAMRRLAITAPKNKATPSDLVERLGRLNLANQPMTATEAEYTYLERCAYAANVHNDPKVVMVRNATNHADEIAAEIGLARAHEMVGKSDSEIVAFANKIRLEAETRALRDKVVHMREAVAHATGHPNGNALISSPTYDPTPRRSGGRIVWSRFDATPAALAAWNKKALTHNIQGEGIVQIVKNSGVLAAQETRYQIGSKSPGMSKSADRVSGGASSVFFYGTPAGKNPTHGVIYEGEQLKRVLARSDIYGTPGDAYGATNPTDHHYTKSMSRDIKTMASHAQIMVEGGVDLIREPPTRIYAGGDRDSVIAAFKARGVTHFHDGRSVESVVK